MGSGSICRRALANHDQNVDGAARRRRLADLIAANVERAQALAGAEVDLGARCDDDRWLTGQTICRSVET